MVGRKHRVNGIGIYVNAARLALLFIVLAVPLGWETAKADEGKRLEIINPSFEACEEDGAQRIRDWTFEAIDFKFHGPQVPISIDVETNEHGGEADFNPSTRGQGVLLKCKNETARGDLLSRPLEVDPYTWIAVKLEYSIESGKPALFVTLRPEDDRKAQDIAFYPDRRLGKKCSELVRVHSGISSGPYVLSVSINGKGSARIYSVEAFEGKAFETPDKSIFVLDIGHDDPQDSYDHTWRSVRKVLDVFGFPSIEFVHYKEFTQEKFDAVDPGLIILSPLFGGGKKRPDLEALINSQQTLMDSGLPMVGICAGHQMLARMYPDAEHGGKQAEWGPTKLKIVKKDPLFDNLPHKPYFTISESHNFAVKDAFEACDLLATSKTCKAQIFRYKEKPWYTFQGHIEAFWDSACPESCVLWKNMLCELGLIKMPEED